jgi:PAS domain S-box-containing protein
LSLLGVSAGADYPAFVLTVLWIGITALCVWWPLADNGLVPQGAGFTWNRFEMHLAGTVEVLHVYLPWTVAVCLVMWFGLEWAAVPLYLATLFSTLYKHMPADLAVVNALHNPLAIAVYFLFYCNYKGDYALRSLRSWAWFALASLVAAFVSSLGSFISEFTGTALVGGGSLLEAWLGWVPNAFLLAVMTSAPLIFLFSPAVEHLKQRHFSRARGLPYSQRELVLAASMFAIMLVLFLVVEDQWMSARVSMLLHGSMPETARVGIEAQFSAERFVIWLLALLLAGISLGGVFFTSRWVERLRRRYVSEARETRDALRRSEANFRNFFENSPAPMLLYDRDNGEFVDVNLAAIEIYGYSRSEFQEMTIFDIRPPEDIPKLKAYLHEMERDLEDHRHAGEWRHLTKTGVLMYVEVRVSYLVMDNRALNLVAVHDVSPRKLAQAAVERRARELQQLAASSLQIASVRTVEEVLQIAADRARELTGARLAVTHCWDGSGSASQLRASLAEEYASWRGFGERPQGLGIYRLLKEKQYPIRLTTQELDAHPDYLRFGEHRDRHPPLRGLLAVPLTSSGADVIGALMVSDRGGEEFDAEDEAILVQLAQISSAGIESVRLREALELHMQELERRVLERTAELDASNKELDAFAYSVAHDLRAPLRAMHGFADALLEDYGAKLDQEGRDYLKRIVKGAKNMDGLIQDLLAYSRVGRDKTALEPVPLAETVQDVLNDLHAEIEASKGEVEVTVPPLTVLAHKATLRTVLLNLVSNALKFVAPGKAPRVRIWAVARRGTVDICVRDNGIGIAPEHQERIFNVFERLHGAEAYPGTGIGLSIVKKGLASMQGEISIESGGDGSTFHATLKEHRNG